MLKIIKIHKLMFIVHHVLRWDFLLPYLCSSHIFTCNLWLNPNILQDPTQATSSLKPFLISLVFTTGHTAGGWLISFLSLLPLNYNGVLFCFSYYSFNYSFIHLSINPYVYSTNFKDFLDHNEESILCARYNNGHRIWHCPRMMHTV